MRLNPGPLDGTRCLACGGQFSAVAVGIHLFPECDGCDLSPAEAYFAAQAIEAGTAETVKLGSVHESAVGETDAPAHSQGVR